MSQTLDSSVAFLAYIGIAAQVLFDDAGNRVIQMPTMQYEPRRKVIDPWYTLVYQSGDQSFFRERKRGTGMTSF